MTVGQYAARTVLLELICAGARIAALTVALAVEYDSLGKEILAASRMALAQIGSRAPVIWSSEKNFEVDTTGVGVTAVGVADASSIRIGRSRRGDAVALFGQPSVGKGVLEAERKNLLPTLEDAIFLTNSELVHEVLPVGSTGVLHEASVMAHDSGLRFVSSIDSKELRVSAGPSTALAFSFAPSEANKLKERLDKPLVVVGSLERRT